MIKDKLPTYSVLMSVYSRDNPQFLRLAIDSMLNQTVKTNDFVIVEDGEIGADLNSVIEEYSSKFDCFNIIKLTRNVGLGKALDAGIKYCKNNYVARMDADDISLLNRCEKQLKVFAKDPTLSIVGSWVDEFDIDIAVTLGTADLRINQLLKLGRGAVVELDRNVNDCVDIYANNILIGHGEVVITENETIGISVTDMVQKR